MRCLGHSIWDGAPFWEDSRLHSWDSFGILRDLCVPGSLFEGRLWILLGIFDIYAWLTFLETNLDSLGFFWHILEWSGILWFQDPSWRVFFFGSSWGSLASLLVFRAFFEIIWDTFGILWDLLVSGSFWLFFRDSPEVLWYLCLYLGQSLRFFEGYFGILWDPLVSRSFLNGFFGILLRFFCIFGIFGVFF